jgi:hypothetical protein
MDLAKFLGAGLTEVPGGKVRYASPKTMEQTLKIAFSELEAENQEKFNANFIIGLT